MFYAELTYLLYTYIYNEKVILLLVTSQKMIINKLKDTRTNLNIYQNMFMEKKKIVYSLTYLI